MEITWNIPNEGCMLDRLEELRMVAANLPDSALVPIWNREIRQIEQYFSHEPSPEAAYVSFAVYECSKRPTDYGLLIGRTPILQQALDACENARRIGKSYFIKGVEADGTEMLFL